MLCAVIILILQAYLHIHTPNQNKLTAKDIKVLCIYIYAVVHACETPLLV